MKLNYDKKSKDPTYFIQMGIRNGKKTTTKNVARIGKHSELLKITDDPLAYAKEQVKKYNEEYNEKKKVSLDLKIDFAQKLKASNDIESKSTNSNIGYFFLQQIYHDLKIKSFFDKITADTKIKFDPNLVNRFLTVARIISPDSKLGTSQNLNHFYEKPEFDYVHILRTMDILADHYDEYITHLFEKSCDVIKRDTSVCFYDCSTNDDFGKLKIGDYLNRYRLFVVILKSSKKFRTHIKKCGTFSLWSEKVENRFHNPLKLGSIL